MTVITEAEGFTPCDEFRDLTSIRVLEKDGQYWLRLNRPDRRNAFDAALHTECTIGMERLVQNGSVRTVLISGEGEHFSVGGDLAWFANITTNELDQVMDEARRLVLAFLALEAPVISAVRGSAVGIGATVALLADFVVAADDASFMDPHVTAGLVAGDGSAAIWPLLVGLGNAKRYLLLADRLQARKAHELGLVGWVVPDGDVLDQALEISGRLAKGPQAAIRGTKRALNKHLEAAIVASLDLSIAREKATFTTPDHHEAVRAFLDKRAPRFL